MKLLVEPGMKKRTLDGFGDRLAQIRKARGLTQGQLGKAAGVSYRVIAYYEQEDAQPPGAILVDLARTLKVSTDELLGLKPAREKPSPRTARLLNRLSRVGQLPRADQQAVLKMVDALVKTRAGAGANGR